MLISSLTAVQIPLWSAVSAKQVLSKQGDVLRSGVELNKGALNLADSKHCIIT